MDQTREPAETLGRLHDAYIVQLTWKPKDSLLEIEIEDFEVEMVELPGYKGITPGRIVLSQVSRFEANVNLSDNSLMIYDWKFTKERESYLSVINFWPSGTIVLESGEIEIVFGDRS